MEFQERVRSQMGIWERAVEVYSAAFLMILVLMCLYGVDTVAADDLQVIRDRIVNAKIPGNGESAARAAQDYMNTIQTDGSWADIDYAHKARSRWHTAEHVSRISTMTLAYADQKSALKDNTELLEKTLAALDYWLEKDFQNPNWWWNQIGIPRSLGVPLLILEDSLSAEQKAKAVALMKRSKWDKWTGQNLTWGATIQIMRGCIENNPEVVADAYKRLYEEIRVFPPGKESIQVDYSFHQHGSQLYSGGYGRGFAQDNARFHYYARETQFAAPKEVLDVLVHYLLDGQQWMVRGTVYDHSVVGREITRSGSNAAGIGDAAAMMAQLPTERSNELADFAQRMKTGTPPFSGNRHFWRSDYMAHHRPEYFSSVRMTSNRNIRSEICNDEGRKSHHLADGVCYLYKTGEEYRNLFPVWDWERVPGITCRLTQDWSGKVNAKGETAFVGGVSDGTYGLAAMDFKRDGLIARKAWAFFEDEVIWLGCDINDATAAPVITSINQCHLKGTVATSTETELSQQTQLTLNGPGWIWHNRVGYVFPEPCNLQVSNKSQSGSWADIGTGSTKEETHEVFSCWIDHGENPENASYVCRVYPEIEKQSIAGCLSSHDTVVVANTPEQQTVFNEKINLLMAAFYMPGSVAYADGQTLEVNEPCLVLVRETSDKLFITVSNPCNKALEVQCIFNCNLAGEGCEAIADNKTRVTFLLPDGNHAGSSITQCVQKQGV